MSMVRAQNLWKIYPARYGQVEAVRGISLEVPQGGFLAVMGRSGSGKSTLLSIMGGLSRPTQGTIHVGGVDIWAMSDDQRAEFRNRRIGFVLQFSGLLPTLRAIDNVALPVLLGPHRDLGSAYARAEALLSRVGLGDRLDAYPSELSGGEQRRVALARALGNAPPLLLADEPTGDLDEETEAEIMGLLLDVNRTEGITIVMVTHNSALAGQAHRVLRIKEGSVAA